MNLKVGIVGLPNAGPGKSLAIPEVYVLASWCRVYGARRVNYIHEGGLDS